MNRFRGTDVALGLVAVVVNVGLVVGVVSMTTDEESPEAAPSATPSATATPSPSPTPTASDDPADPETARELFASGDPVSIAVLGDQTSDGESEWVGVFAALLGQDHTATVHTLDPSDPTIYSGKRSYGSSGPDVTIHNASRAGVRADYAARRLPLLVPDEADLVILNYGRNDGAERIVSRLQKTTKAVRTQLPEARIVVTLQPPTAGDGQEDVREATAAWAEKADLAVLEVAEAFQGTGRPDGFVSSRDPLVMSTEGDELWGEVAYTRLTGQELPTQVEDPTVVDDPTAGSQDPQAPRTSGPTSTSGGGGTTEPDPTPTVTTTPTADPTPTPDPTPTDPPEPTEPPTSGGFPTGRPTGGWAMPAT